MQMLPEAFAHRFGTNLKSTALTKCSSEPAYRARCDHRVAYPVMAIKNAPKRGGIAREH